PILCGGGVVPRAACRCASRWQYPAAHRPGDHSRGRSPGRANGGTFRAMLAWVVRYVRVGVMAGSYTVKQGDHVPGIAWRFGFSDYLVIWNHPNNAELKKKRQNPNVLYPGDSLYIPDRKEGEYSRPTDQKHQFVVKRKPLKLHLTLRDQYETPIANAACV